ncbi:hypothetical protein F5Y05DRAFT_237209 [Hypoxylon sp. FL0543]|nr:hypothetical protein F5Y05DRAFT_237209 [Hypoxylon sp. FL0543]
MYTYVYTYMCLLHIAHALGTENVSHGCKTLSSSQLPQGAGSCSCRWSLTNRYYNRIWRVHSSFPENIHSDFSAFSAFSAFSPSPPVKKFTCTDWYVNSYLICTAYRKALW